MARENGGSRGLRLSLFNVLSLAIWMAIIGVYLSGWLVPLENFLRDQRFRVTRNATHEIIFVDIDAETLADVGVWPWPRGIYADLIDRLLDAGALDIFLDVDFSTSSREAGDAALEAALERAGGFVMLAAFQNGADNSYNLPLPRFLEHARAVTVNVGIDTRGIVRTYPYGLNLGEKSVPSAAAALAGGNWVPEAAFPIDFSIPVDAIERVSAGDVLGGTLPAGLFEGRQVVVGASALELRDIFATPVAPAVPGALVQIVAAETLKQGRALVPLGAWPTVIGIVLVGLGALAIRASRLPLALLAGVGTAAAVEGLALVLQSNFALLIDTAALQLAVGFFLLRALGLEIVIERLLRLTTARERDAMRKILDRVIADNFDGVVVVDADGRVLTSSRLAETVLGHKVTPGEDARKVLPWVLSEAVSAQFAGAVSQPRPLALQVDVGGVLRTIEYTVTRSDVPGRSEQTARRVVCVTFRDVTDRDAAAQHIQYLAEHDPLTGTFSRHQLIRLIDEALAKPGAAMTVILVGLGRFKAVNATLGHAYGDQVLKQVAERLAAQGYSVARIGGTTFGLARAGAPSAGALTESCRDLTMVLSEPYFLPGGHRAVVTASVGGTTSVLSPGDAELLLRHADMALASAKDRAGNEAAVFDAAMEARVKDAQDLQLALRDALAAGQFHLVYQPQLALGSREPIGAEVLVRWKHPTLGDISPARFIPIAEETGLVLDLGRWVLGAACREAATWPGTAHLAVNVSPLQLELSDVLSQVVGALAESKLPPERLEVEITEGVFVSASTEVIDTLEALRKLGVHIALDDFGTGYSSLSYLSRLPVDKLKIDQSFVRGMPSDKTSLAVVDAIIRLGSSLGKTTIAEGIETEEQAALLARMGCREGQGFLFSPPITSRQMAHILGARLAVGTRGS